MGLVLCKFLSLKSTPSAVLFIWLQTKSQMTFIEIDKSIHDHVYMYVCMYVRMYVCLYVRTYVCMYVCMYVGIYLVIV